MFALEWDQTTFPSLNIFIPKTKKHNRISLSLFYIYIYWEREREIIRCDLLIIWFAYFYGFCNYIIRCIVCHLRAGKGFSTFPHNVFHGRKQFDSNVIQRPFSQYSLASFPPCFVICCLHDCFHNILCRFGWHVTIRTILISLFCGLRAKTRVVATKL
jgi:hypothetical protein